MADGNFNRSMLPYKDYQSGLRAGRAQMRTLAHETLKALLEAQNGDPAEQTELLQAFKKELDKK